MKSRLSDSVFSGAVWLLTSSAMQSVSKLMITAVLGRLLTPADFGLIAAAMTVIVFANMLNSMGSGSYLVQKNEIGEKHYNTVFTYSLLVGFGSLLVLYVGNPLIARFYHMPKLTGIMNVLIWIFPIQALYRVTYSHLQRELMFKKMAGLEIISYVVSYGVIGIALAYFGFGVWALVWAALSQSVLYAVALFIVSPLPLKLEIDKPILSEISKQGSGYTVINFFSFGAKNADYLVVGNMLNAAALGIYSRAFNLMNAPQSIFGSALNKILFARFSRAQAEGEKLERLLERSLSVLLFISVPFSVFCLLNAREIVLVLLGDQWELAILPFQILSVGMIVRLGYSILSSYLIGKGNMLKGVYTHLFHFILIIAGSVVGVYLGEVKGVAIGVTVALILAFAFFLVASVRDRKFIYLKLLIWFFKNVLLVLPYAGLFLLIRYLFFGSNEFLLISLNGAAFGVVYLLYYRFKLYSFLGEEVSWFINKFAGFKSKK